MFNCGEGLSGASLDGQLLEHLAWNSSGKLLTCSLGNMVNIWVTGGTPRGVYDDLNKLF